MQLNKLPFERGVAVRRTTLIIIGLLCLMAGLWLTRNELPVPMWLLLSAISLVPLCLSRKPIRAVMVVVVVCLAIGLLRGNVVWREYRQYKKLTGSVVTLKGVALEDSVYNDRGEREFYFGDITNRGNRLPGKMRVSGFVGPLGIERGDNLVITGKVREGFGSYQAAMSFAKIEVTSRQPSIIAQIRNQFFAGVYSALPEPQSSLGLGFLVGVRALLPDELVTQLSRTGLTHIVAVSGYNLTVLVRVSRRTFMRISKFSATAISFGLILFFLSVTGLSPSIFRASIVSVVALAAWYYGRPVRPMMLLGLSGAITALINPFFIWFDLGWWLSFTAFFGALVLAPTLTRRIFHTDGKDLPMPLQIAIESACAQIMALPIIVVIFGELSIISLLANILIIPLIPLAMLLTFIAGIAGMLLPAAAGWLAFPAKVLLVAMTAIISILAGFSWALIEVKVSWFSALVWYAGVLLMYAVMYFKLSSSQKKQLAYSNHLE